MRGGRVTAPYYRPIGRELEVARAAYTRFLELAPRGDEADRIRELMQGP